MTFFPIVFFFFYPLRAHPPFAGLRWTAGSHCRCSWNPQVRLPRWEEMRGENRFSWIREITFPTRQQMRPGITKAFSSLFPLSHSFFAQTIIKRQHPGRGSESTGAWPRTANSNPGQAVPVCLTEGAGLDCAGFFCSSEKRFSCTACRHPKENTRASYTLQPPMSGEQHCGVLTGRSLPVCGAAAAKGRPSILLTKVDDITGKQKWPIN